MASSWLWNSYGVPAITGNATIGSAALVLLGPQLSRPPWEQERPVQMARGADCAVYIVSIPIKGQLGGALTRLEPQTKKLEVHCNIIPNQSILGVAALPNSSLLIGASGIQGGSSAVPSEKEA